VVMSVQEVANLLDGDGIIVEGFGVHTGSGGYSHPLSNSRETGLARSQLPEELFRHSLGPFARIDISPVVGHRDRWRKDGVSEAEQAAMDEFGRLVVASGFPVTLAMGEQASDTLEAAFREAASRQPLLPPPVVGGQSFDFLEAFEPSRPQLFARLPHPSNLLGGLVGTQAAMLFAETLDAFVTAVTGALPRFSLATYVEQHGEDDGEEFWNSLLQARALRSWELFTKGALALEKCPASVREAVAMAFGGITTQQEFLRQDWRPRQATTREPFSATAFFLSDMGMAGGRESAYQAELQVERMDPSGHLMGIDLRLWGIRSDDTRVFSKREVQKMLDELQELRREWGRLGGLESMRRANEQALRLDPSGRFMGIHLRILGIGRGCKRSGRCRLNAEARTLAKKPSQASHKTLRTHAQTHRHKNRHRSHSESRPWAFKTHQTNASCPLLRPPISNWRPDQLADLIIQETSAR
jgi:hypothetical protein